MPSDMDHLHGTDTRDARIAELRAENERLRKELDVCEYVKRVDAAREDARKEAALEAILVVQSEPELLGDPPEGFDELVAKVGLIRSARALVKEVKACIQERLGQHFGLDAKPEPAESLYYIQNTGYCGNCLKWWRVDGKGYTMDLNDAWKVPIEKAREICRSRPTEDIIWAADLIDRLSTRHLNCEALRSFNAKRMDF